MDVTIRVVISSLEKNEIDFALVSVLPASLNIEKLDLLQNKLFWLKAKLILKGLKIQKTYLQKYHLFIERRVLNTSNDGKFYREKYCLIEKKWN
jgi:hypothetical protein